MNTSSTKLWVEAELLKAHSLVIYINTKVEGVAVPPHLKAKESITLKISHHFDRPLIFKENELRSDFQFDFGFQTCVIPWKSVWAAHPEGEIESIHFWNENSPGEGWDLALREYLGVVEKEFSAPKSGSEIQKTVKQKEKLQVVKQKKPKVEQPLEEPKNEDADSSATVSTEGFETRKEVDRKPRSNHLKLVK